MSVNEKTGTEKLKHKLGVILHFRKKYWIPLAWVLALLFTFVVLPNLFALVFGMAVQGIYLVAFMGIQVIGYFAIFFWFLAGRVRIVKVLPGDSDLTWDDYRGQPELLEKVVEWTKSITGSQSLDEIGGQFQPGILFEGVPGCGKTHLAKVMASECQMPFLSVDAPSLMGTFVGIGPLKVSRLFATARNLAREYGGCFLFLDEIDSIGKTRGGVDPTGTRNEPLAAMPMFGMGSQILNSVLAQLDGFAESRPRTFRIRGKLARFFGFKEPVYKTPRVMVIGSTNVDRSLLDPALIRPGRLGKIVTIQLPDQDGLLDIARYYLGKIKHQPYLTPERVATVCAGRTPAFIEQVLVRDAPTLSVIGDSPVVRFEDFQRAVSEAAMGERQRLPLTHEERMCLAVHEAGHAVVLMAEAYPRLKPMYLTIEKHGRSLGHLLPVEAIRWHIGRTFSQLQVALKMYLGGIAAEELFLGERHNSAGGDMPMFQRTYDLMLRAGMFQHWPGELEEKEEQKERYLYRKAVYQETKEILKKHAKQHQEIVDALLDKGSLHEEEIIALWNGSSR